MADWYCSSVGYAAVTQWAANTEYSVGDLRRQLAAPTVGNERVFRCTTAGTSHTTTEPTWIITKAGTTNDGTVVWTEVTGDSTYGWTAPHARLANAFAWAAAGDTIYVSKSHNENSTTSVQLFIANDINQQLRVICVDDETGPGAPTVLANTAIVSVTGTGSVHPTLGISGSIYFYGITFNASINSTQANSLSIGSAIAPPYYNFMFFENCVLHTAGERIDQYLSIGDGSGFADRGPSYVIFKNTSYKANKTDGYILLNRAKLIWINSIAVTGNVIPTILFKFSNNNYEKSLILNGVNLSNINTTLVSKTARTGLVDIQNCKLHPSVTLTTGTITTQTVSISFTNCSSSDTNYQHQKETYQGIIAQESTVYRTGGATDGTTPISRKMISSSNSQFFSPLELGPITVWNDTVGSQLTATIEVITDNVTLTDADCWLEVEHLGTSGSTQSSFLSDRKTDILATALPQTTSLEHWATTGLSKPIKQKLSVTFTPQEKGPINCRVMLAKPSTTVYVCPKVELSDSNLSVRQFQANCSYINETRESVAGATTGTLKVPGTASYASTLTKETGANARGSSGTCAKLDPTSTTDYGYWHFYIPVTIGNTATLSFYYKKSVANFDGTVDVTIYDIDQTTKLLDAETVSMVSQDTVYRRHDCAAITPSGTGLCLVEIRIKDGVNTGCIYFDDFTVD